MVAPLMAAAVAAPIAGGLISYMGTKQALKANAAERERIAQLVNKLQDPKFDFSKLTPKDYELVGEYVPQYSNLLAEAAPEIVKDSEAAKEGMQAQRSALQRLMQISQGPDIEQQAASEMAARQNAIANQGSIASLREMQARQGAAPGSGLGYATALQQMQSGQQAAAMAGQQGALDAYRNRLQAMKDAASIGSSVTGQERSLAANNANIINAYNQQMSNLRQRNIDLANEAQLKNLGMKQDISNRNIGQSNEADRYNQENYNRLQQQMYDNAMGKINVQAGLSGQAQQGNLAAAQAKNQAIMGAAQGIGSGALYAYDKSQAQPQQPTYDPYNDPTRKQGDY